jgi:hypothetical protein
MVASFRLPDGLATDTVGEVYEAAVRRNVLGITSKSNPPALEPPTLHRDATTRHGGSAVAAA